MKEKVSYGGKVFTRNLDSKNWSKRMYFVGHKYNRITKKSKEVYLHRVIWEDNRGPIPCDCVIHHKDGNPLNNDISNLECIPEYLHLRTCHKNRGNLSYPTGSVISSGN